MKYFFSASSREIAKYIKRFNFIINTLDTLGHVSTRDWVEEAYSRQKGSKVIDRTEWKQIHKHVSEAVLSSDFIIADISEPSFSVGYQVALAIQHKKPILILSEKPLSELKHSFGANIDSELISFRQFSEETCQLTINDFIREYCLMGKPTRFSFFIDQKIHNFLRGEAFAKNQTKAEILRDIIEEHIKRSN